MWVSKNLDRARRRFRPGADDALPPPADGATDVADADVALSLVRSDLERLVAALGRSLPATTPRPDSPARLEDGLAVVIRRIGGRGRAVVTRSPAALYSPEYWHLRIEGADARTRAAVERLAAGEAVA